MKQYEILLSRIESATAQTCSISYGLLLLHKIFNNLPPHIPKLKNEPRKF
jgi:hypothetical protein